MDIDRKIAIVYKDESGYWAVEDMKTHERIGPLYLSELDAYKAANRYGYIVE